MREPLYLSMLLPDLRSSKVRRDLSDCVEMHRTLMRAFPDCLGPAGRAQVGLLYRVEVDRLGWVRILAQSLMRPDWERLPEGWLREDSKPEVKDIGWLLDRFQPGVQLRFRLLANPTRKICTKTPPNGLKTNGRRVELRGEEQWIAWLERKGSQHGFRLVSVRCCGVPDVVAMPAGRLRGCKKGDGQAMTLTFFGVQFEGRLEVVDPRSFIEGLRCGIGPGKAFGFGLLSVAPVWLACA